MSDDSEDVDDTDGEEEIPDEYDLAWNEDRKPEDLDEEELED